MHGWSHGMEQRRMGTVVWVGVEAECVRRCICGEPCIFCGELMQQTGTHARSALGCLRSALASWLFDTVNPAISLRVKDALVRSPFVLPALLADFGKRFPKVVSKLAGIVFATLLAGCHQGDAKTGE